MNTQIEVLVIGRPSRFRGSLHLLLASISFIERTHLANDLESALTLTAIPAVVVLDTDVAASCLSATIKKIKAAWPQARLIILVEDEPEFQAGRAAGGDALLRKGFPATKFIEAVERLLAK